MSGRSRPQRSKTSASGVSWLSPRSDKGSAALSRSLNPSSMRNALKLGATARYSEPDEDELAVHKAEKLRVMDVLSRLGPEETLDHLLRTLSAADQRTRIVSQRALTELFPAKYFPLPDISAAHCIRCHHGFDTKYNYAGDCRIMHSDAPGREHTLVSRTSTTTTWKLACCEKLVTGSHLDDYYVPNEADGFCFEGRHTLNTDDVEWYNYVNMFKCNGNGKAIPCSRTPAPRSFEGEGEPGAGQDPA